MELVELTGRVIRSDKRGYINNNQPKILERLGIEQDKWLTLTTSFEKNFKDLVGNPHRMDTAIALLVIVSTRALFPTRSMYVHPWTYAHRYPAYCAIQYILCIKKPLHFHGGASCFP